MQFTGAFGQGAVFVRFDDTNDFSLVPPAGELPENLSPPVSMVLADHRLKDAVDVLETKLRGSKSPDQEHLLRQSKSLSDWLKHQDELIVSDAERLKRTQSKVKLLVRDFQIHALPLGKHLKHRELALEKRLLKVRKMVKEFEAKYFQKPFGDTLAPISKGFQKPSSDTLAPIFKRVSLEEFEANNFQKPSSDTLAPIFKRVSLEEFEANNFQKPFGDTFAPISKGVSLKGEPELDEKLAAVSKEMKGVHLSVNAFASHPGVPSNVDKYLPTSVKIDERSLADLQQALQQQKEAITKLGDVLNREIGEALQQQKVEHREQGEQAPNISC